MRILLTGAAVAALALASAAGAGATSCTMTGMMTIMMPKCTSKTGPVVWYIASSKLYYMKGSSHYGKGTGKYVCRATAVGGGGHPGMAGTMGGSHATPLPITQTMAPRPMSSGNPMSGNQGNTGAPGAGGQVPNNPASSSNSSPSPSPHP